MFPVKNRIEKLNASREFLFNVEKFKVGGGSAEVQRLSCGSAEVRRRFGGGSLRFLENRKENEPDATRHRTFLKLFFALDGAEGSFPHSASEDNKIG